MAIRRRALEAPEPPTAQNVICLQRPFRAGYCREAPTFRVGEMDYRRRPARVSGLANVSTPYPVERCIEKGSVLFDARQFHTLQQGGGRSA